MTTPDLDNLVMPYSIQLESGVIQNVLHITDAGQRNSPRFSYCHRLDQGSYLVQVTYTGPGRVTLAVSHDMAGWTESTFEVPSGTTGVPRSITCRVIVPINSFADLRLWNTDSDRHFGSLEIYPTTIYRKP